MLKLIQTPWVWAAPAEDAEAKRPLLGGDAGLAEPKGRFPRRGLEAADLQKLSAMAKVCTSEDPLARPDALSLLSQLTRGFDDPFNPRRTAKCDKLGEQEVLGHGTP